MRLAAITLKNFRCYKDPIRLQLDNLTMLVGRNDAGKSSIFEALAVFFEEATLDRDDLSVSAPDGEIEITCEFCDVPSELVLDSDVPTSLAGEYLLNSAGHLVIRKTYNASLAKPKPLPVVALANHPTAEGYADLLQLKNADLKKRAKALGVPLDHLDQRRNPDLRKAIWEHADDLALAEVAVPLEEANAKTVWKALSACLPAFALFKADRPSTDQDEEAQDPLRAAIKSALAEKQAELDEIAAYVETEVGAVAEATLQKLREMDPELASELRPQFKTTSWASGFKVSLTDDAQVPINKRGSGVRRLILLNFFRAKAERAATDAEKSSVIYAVEEPETSQHPNNQLLLLSAFQDLAALPGNQVLLTSHTPVLARRLPTSALRFIETEGGGSRVVHGPNEHTNHLIASALGVLADHDVKVFVGVEGKHDIEFLRRISSILAAAGEAVPDLASAEAKGQLVFIPLGGSNLFLWISRLKKLNKPEIHIFDRDTQPPADAKYQEQADLINAQPYSTAVITSKREMENYIHPAAIMACRPELNPLPPVGDFVDVPRVIAQHVHQLSGSAKTWDEIDEGKRKKKESSVKAWLNRDAVTHMTPSMLHEIDPKGDVVSWLRLVGEKLG